MELSLSIDVQSHFLFGERRALVANLTGYECEYEIGFIKEATCNLTGKESGCKILGELYESEEILLRDFFSKEDHFKRVIWHIVHK